jgi:hypothetical protein
MIPKLGKWFSETIMRKKNTRKRPADFTTAFSSRSRFVHSFAPDWTRDYVCGAASFLSRIGLMCGLA